MAYSVAKASLIDYAPEALEEFHVYGFEWIDNLHFILPPQDFVADAARYEAVARQRFLEAGWDGDGEIGLLWLPPFVFPLAMKIAPTGVLLWHVKQTEDDVSWLLSPVPLSFDEFSGS